MPLTLKHINNRSLQSVMQLLRMLHNYMRSIVRSHESIRTIMQPDAHLRTTAVRCCTFGRDLNKSCNAIRWSYEPPCNHPQWKRLWPVASEYFEHVKKSAATCLQALSLARLQVCNKCDQSWDPPEITCESSTISVAACRKLVSTFMWQTLYRGLPQLQSWE